MPSRGAHLVVDAVPILAADGRGGGRAVHEGACCADPVGPLAAPHVQLALGEDLLGVLSGGRCAVLAAPAATRLLQSAERERASIKRRPNTASTRRSVALPVEPGLVAGRLVLAGGLGPLGLGPRRPPGGVLGRRGGGRGVAPLRLDLGGREGGTRPL